MLERARTLAPGVALCIVVAGVAHVSALAQQAAGLRVIDAYVGAILLGCVLRSLSLTPASAQAGISYSSSFLLEVAVALLGASIGYGQTPGLTEGVIAGAVAIVIVGVPLGYAFGRLLGVARNQAMLVACGVSICGNSAIAAVAPVIRADPRETASAIAFTAIWGLPLAIVYPFAFAALALTPAQYGAFAGLTIYSVPQVLAAALPLGAQAAQAGAFVKLVRVMMLAPVIVVASLLWRRGEGLTRLSLPWFIWAFLALMTLRSLGLVPPDVQSALAGASNLLTLIAMAALGLATDARLLARSASRISIAALVSMTAVVAMGYAIVRLAG